MNKGTKKAEKFKFNAEIIDKMIEKYGMTRYYIKQCALGRRSGIVPDKIKKEYAQLALAATKAIESKIGAL